MVTTSGTRGEFRRRLTRWRRSAPAVPLALAVAAGQALEWMLQGWGAAVMLAVLGLLCVACRGRGGALISGAIVGLVAAQVASARPPAIPAVDDATVIGVVDEAPRRPRVGEVLFSLRTGWGGDSVLIRCRAVDLPWRNASQLEAGSLVVVRGRFTPVERAMNPFSWGGWLWRKGFSGECRALFVSKPSAHTTSFAVSLREYIKNSVKNAVGDSVGSGLFLSMSLGFHDLLSVQHERAFMALGLTHLLVVSGYQVSLMFGCMMLVASCIIQWFFRGSRYARILVGSAALAAASCYVYCIGLEMSAVRAWMAAACVAAQFLSDRRTSFWQRWGVALLLMQLVWPWCVFDIGVILTFAALAGIGIGAQLGGGTRIGALVAVNFVVWLTTSLVVVIWRGTFSPLGLLLNLLIAAPWSIANCTYGLLAFVLLVSGVPGAQSLLELLTLVNGFLAAAVLELGEGRFRGWELEWPARLATTAAMAVTSAYVARRACQKAL